MRVIINANTITAQPPGDGKIDWAKLIAHLNRLQFGGTVCRATFLTGSEYPAESTTEVFRRFVLLTASRLDALGIEKQVTLLLMEVIGGTRPRSRAPKR